MNRILVTGGAGYVGAVLVPKLLRHGFEVTVLDLFLYANETLFQPEAISSGQLRLIRGDLCQKKIALDALDGIGCVIHLAGISNDPSSDLDPNLTRKINIDGSKQLIDLARENSVRRFINASSSSVYGIKDDPEVTEELPLSPLTVYSESKCVIEKYLRDQRGPMTAVSIRSATVCGYSPRMRLDLTVNLLTYHALTKGKITVFGGGQKRPNIHIDDITDLYADLVDYPEEKINGKEFNACAANHTVMGLAEMVQDLVAPETPIEVVPTDDLRSYHISADKIRTTLGFVPRKSIGQAIKDVAQAIQTGMISTNDSEQYYNVRLMKKVLKERNGWLHRP